MNDQPNAPLTPAPSSTSTWVSTWMAALTKPSEQTFSMIAFSPDAKLTTAFLWVFLASLVNFFLVSLVQGALLRQFMQSSDLGLEGFPQAAGGGLITAICGAPIGALFSVVGFAIFVGVVQLVAKMFGGRGTFDQLAYATAAIVAPFSVISGLLTLLSAIPLVGLCFGLVSLLAVLYVIALEVMAVKGVNQFGWGQALGSYFLPFLVLFCCLSVGLFGIFQALGPDFSEILNSLTPPAP